MENGMKNRYFKLETMEKEEREIWSKNRIENLSDSQGRGGGEEAARSGIEEENTKRKIYRGR